MATRLSAPLALLLVLWAASPTAHAAPSNSARAEDLIRQANEYRRKNQAPAALPLLREAYEIARSPRTAAQLGLVEMALGYWVEADDHLGEALAPAHHPWVDSNRTVLEQSRASVRRHIGTLTIEGRPAGAEVELNSRRIGTFPLSGPIRVGEGDVTIEVKAPRYLPETRTAHVVGGEPQRVSIELSPVPAPSRPFPPPFHGEGGQELGGTGGAGGAGGKKLVDDKIVPPPPPAAPQVPAWRKALPWTLVAGAAIAGGVGAWQHVQWRDAQSKYDGNPLCYSDHPNRGTDPACAGLYDTLAGHRTGAIIGYAAAGALGVGAAVTFFLNADAPESSKGRVGPGPTPLGLSYGGSF
jgi:hypothetical protein